MIKKELIKIKLLSEINESDLLNFYAAAYPLRYKVMYKHWKWIYRTSLFGFEPITINYDNKLAGHAGVISTNINYKNNILKGIWFVDFIIFLLLSSVSIQKRTICDFLKSPKSFNFSE